MTKLDLSPEFSSGLISSSLRAVSLVARFALTIYMGKYLDLRTVGTFGLIYGGTSIAPALIGLGLNFSLNREIIGSDAAYAGARIRDRLSVTAVMVLALFCISAILMSAKVIPVFDHIGVLALIVAFEVFAFDIHMSLISLRMPVLANTLLFVRTASWVFPFILLGMVRPSTRTFTVLTYFWLAALLLTFVVLFTALRNWPWSRIVATRIDLAWIRLRISSGGLIYLSDLGLVGSAFLDRFIVDYSLGLEMTGIFTFFWSISNAIQLLINVGVIQVSLPRLVETFKKEGPAAINRTIRQDLRNVLLLGLALSVLIYAGISFAMPYLGRPKLMQFPWLFPMMLAAATLRLGSDVVNYGLYASQQDNKWAWTNLLGVFLSGSFTLIGLRWFGLIGVGAAMIATSFTLLTTRLFLLSTSIPSNRTSDRVPEEACC